MNSLGICQRLLFVAILALALGTAQAGEWILEGRVVALPALGQEAGAARAPQVPAVGCPNVRYRTDEEALDTVVVCRRVAGL